MHFPIIQLTHIRILPEDWMKEEDICGCPLVEFKTDYIQGINRSEREGWLTWLPFFFDGIADVDLANEKILFKSADEINKTLDSYYREIVDKMQDTERKGWLRFLDIRRYGECYKDIDSLFYINGCLLTSMQFIEDCYHYAGETLHIGGVIDAHA